MSGWMDKISVIEYTNLRFQIIWRCGKVKIPWMAMLIFLAVLFQLLFLFWKYLLIKTVFIFYRIHNTLPKLSDLKQQKFIL